MVILLKVLFLSIHFAQASSPSVISNEQMTQTFYNEALLLNPNNPAVFYNKGLHFINTDLTGLAIAYLREAKLLAPRHTSTRDALKYIQLQLKSKGFQSFGSLSQTFEDIIGDYFQLPEVLSLHWVFSLVCLIILGKFFRDQKRAKLKSDLGPSFTSKHIVLYSTWVLLSVFLLLKISSTLNQQATIIQKGAATLRSGPLNEAASIGDIPEGALVSVKEVYKDWVQIRYNEGPTGWVAKNHLLILTPDGFK